MFASLALSRSQRCGGADFHCAVAMRAHATKSLPVKPSAVDTYAVAQTAQHCAALHLPHSAVKLPSEHQFQGNDRSATVFLGHAA
eukprot:13627660-Alexandrium_andersonii.AAC.1